MAKKSKLTQVAVKIGTAVAKPIGRLISSRKRDRSRKRSWKIFRSKWMRSSANCKKRRSDFEARCANALASRRHFGVSVGVILLLLSLSSGRILE